MYLEQISKKCLFPVGPTHPLAKEGIATRNHKSGHVEDYNVHSFVFDEQHRTYDRWVRVSMSSTH